jgi:hypothetical protein
MALQMMAPGTAISSELALVTTFAREIAQRLGAAIVARMPGVLDSYRPELHYMRGPGPKWREKHGLGARKKNAVHKGAITRHLAPRTPQRDQPPHYLGGPRSLLLLCIAHRRLCRSGSV